MIDEQHIAQIAQLEQQKKAAVEAAEQAMKTATERQFQAHEAELEALRAAHARATSALRGELEPKVAEARNLAAEIERLKSELTAQADRIVKGVERGPVWETVTALILELNPPARRPQAA